MNFFDWDVLGTYAGAALAVAIVTQITKDLVGIRKLPTQVWSWLLAAVMLVSASIAQDGFSVSGVILGIINGAVVSLATNGGYAAIMRIKDSVTNSAE